MSKNVVSTPAIVAGSSIQFRNRVLDDGAVYIPACRTLSAWARPSEDNKALVHALIHLGWQSTKGARAMVLKSNSKAWSPKEGKGAKDVLTVGEDAAEAAVRIVQALREAGAPADALDAVWATWTA